MAASKFFFAFIILCVNKSNPKSVDYDYILREGNLHNWINDNPIAFIDEDHLIISEPNNLIIILIPYADKNTNTLRKGTDKKKIFFPKNPRIIFKKKPHKLHKLLKVIKRKPKPRPTRTTKKHTSRTTKKLPTSIHTTVKQRSTTYKPPRSTTYNPTSSTYNPPRSSTYQPPTSSTNESTTTTGSNLQTTSRPDNATQSIKPSGSDNGISFSISNGDNYFNVVIQVPDEKEGNSPAESYNGEIAPTEDVKESVAESGNEEPVPPEDANEKGYDGEGNRVENENVENISQES